MTDEAILDVGGSKNWSGLESSVDSFRTFIELILLVHDLSERTARVDVENDFPTDTVRMTDQIEPAFQPVNQIVGGDVDLQFDTQGHQFVNHKVPLASCRLTQCH